MPQVTTTEDLALVAMSRALEFSSEVPTTRSLMWRRLQVRQAQLFAMAAKLNPDYFGALAEGTLDGTLRVDLRDLVGDAILDPAGTVQRVEIKNIGTSALVSGDRVNLVSIDDVDAELAPRMTLRDFVLKGVGTDLTGVTSVCVAYSRVPDVIAAADGTEIFSLPDQYQELLVVDLTRDLLRKTLALGVEERATAIALVEAEEAPLLADYQAEVAVFPQGASHRFSEPPGTTTR